MINSKIFWYLIAAIISAIPIPIIQKYVDTKNKFYLFLAMLFYLILVLIYAQVLQSTQMSIAYPLIKFLSIILVVVFGVLFFNNKLSTKQIIGILIGGVSLYLLCSGKN
uniref:Membrane protein n=1 Tax=Borely moumouvirus TaxID=2712067 RepID=A0A6G6ACD3_9VIRU